MSIFFLHLGRNAHVGVTSEIYSGQSNVSISAKMEKKRGEKRAGIPKIQPMSGTSVGITNPLFWCELFGSELESRAMCHAFEKYRFKNFRVVLLETVKLYIQLVPYAAELGVAYRECVGSELTGDLTGDLGDIQLIKTASVPTELVDVFLVYLSNLKTFASCPAVKVVSFHHNPGCHHPVFRLETTAKWQGGGLAARAFGPSGQFVLEYLYCAAHGKFNVRIRTAALFQSSYMDCPSCLPGSLPAFAPLSGVGEAQDDPSGGSRKRMRYSDSQ